MAPEDIIIQLVNLTDGYVHLKDGRTWPITAWLNDAFDQTVDPDDAAWFVAGRDGEGYIAERMSDYRQARPH